MTRRRWDYFVRYLGGGVPPVEYEMKPAGRAMEALGMGPEDEGYDPEIFW
jgi:hypothetical protein